MAESELGGQLCLQLFYRRSFVLWMVGLAFRRGRRGGVVGLYPNSGIVATLCRCYMASSVRYGAASGRLTPF